MSTTDKSREQSVRISSMALSVALAMEERCSHFTIIEKLYVLQHIQSGYLHQLLVDEIKS